MHRGHLPFPAGPGPVREDVGHGVVRAPAGLVQPVAVFGETRQVDNTEVGAAGRQRDVAHRVAPAFQGFFVGSLLLLRVEVGEYGRVQVERGGLAQIVVPGPDKLAGAFRHGVLVLPLVVRLGGPAGGV